MTGNYKKYFIFLSFLLACAASFLSGCGSSACDAFTSKVCSECAESLSPEWKAACACHSDSTYIKAYGFHCKEPSSEDQDVCRSGLDLWSSNSCIMLMRTFDERERIQE